MQKQFALLSLLLIPSLIGGTCQTAPPDMQPSENVSFADDVLPIFAARCAACHRSAGSGGDAPPLTNAEAFAAIVNQPSPQRPDLNYVTPSSAATSWLFIKVNSSSPGMGVRMPPGGALSAAEITTIQDWINQGAMNN